jgi:ABC transporter related protein
MKMLLGLLHPSAGQVFLLGEDPWGEARARLMPRIGSMIEHPPGYGHLTGAENMRLLARLLNLETTRIDRALELVRLTDHRDRLQRTYSLGMKQRLGIAMALAREPELLILDEPTNGLDPAGIEEIRELMVHLASGGVTVMISSHLLDEIDRMADVLGVLSQGRLVFQGSRKELFERSIPDLLVVTPQANAAANLVRGCRLERNGIRVQGCGQEDAARLIVRLVQAGIPIHEVRRLQQSLEEVFMDLTGGAEAL